MPANAFRSPRSAVRSRTCWKEPEHFDSWPAGIDPTDDFSSIFANAFPGASLLDVLSADGGKLIALARHAVAA
jgi:hypothetical protein